MRIAYADPPYPGCAKLYKDQSDYDGEVDHKALIFKLYAEFDGFIYHTASTSLPQILPWFGGDVRVMAWVKPFAAFKRNVSVAYAWEPVIIKPVRKPVVSHRIVMRDWISQSITLKKGLVGVKPEAVCRWAFEMVGAEPDDDLIDLYPGSGAVSQAWGKWKTSMGPQGKGEGTT